jgi:hypothetical protein
MARSAETAADLPVAARQLLPASLQGRAAGCGGIPVPAVGPAASRKSIAGSAAWSLTQSVKIAVLPPAMQKSAFPGPGRTTLDLNDALLAEAKALEGRGG